MIYVYKHSVCVCAHSILKWYHMLWQSVFLLMSIQVLEVCDLCCMLGRYPEGDALTLNAPWHADHWEKLFSRCLKTLVWLFWPKMLACLGGFGQGLCTQLVFFIIFEETHINYITGSNLVPIIPLLLADVYVNPPGNVLALLWHRTVELVELKPPELGTLFGAGRDSRLVGLNTRRT